MTDRSRFAVGRKVAYIPRPADNPNSASELWPAVIIAVDPAGVSLSVNRPDGSRITRRGLTRADFVLGFGSGAPGLPAFDPPFGAAPNGDGVVTSQKLQVGTPEVPAELDSGGGDSYSDDVLIYSETPANIFADLSGLNTGGPITLPGVATGNALYLSSDKILTSSGDYLTFPGTKIATSVAAVLGGGAIVQEYWNGSAWVQLVSMATDSLSPYQSHAADIFGRVGLEQVRFSQGAMPLWVKNDPPATGTPRYWMRFRVSSGITTSPTVTQFKLHTNRMEVNPDGFVEMFGLSRVIAKLPWDLGLLRPANASPANQDVYLSDNLAVGRQENKFLDAATDRSGFNALLPGNTCTSCPAIFTWTYFTDDGSAGNIRWVIRWGHTTDGDAVYPTSAAAPTAGPNEQETIVIDAAPAALSIQKTSRLTMVIEDIIATRQSPNFGDLFWLTIERDGTHVDDTHTGDVTLIAIKGEHVIWALGGAL